MILTLIRHSNYNVSMDKIETLNQFLTANKIQATCLQACRKGCVDVFDLQTDSRFRLNKLTRLSQELMLTMQAHLMPSIKINSDKGLLQLEIVSERQTISSLLDDLATYCPIEKGGLPIMLGTSLKGEKITIDASKNPHLLVGGTTGSGKSSLLHTIISNLFSFTNSTIYIVDTKAVEFNKYSKLSNRIKIFESFKEYYNLLKYLIFIMEKRYAYIKDNLISNILDVEIIKPIVLLIDEFADLTMQDIKNEGYVLLCRLLQKCRAAGIYCVLATQRPSADIITGVIKANFPARISCRVASKTDSRVILDQNGAENLIHIGEAIVKNYKYDMEKFQVSFSPPEKIIRFLNEKMAPNP